MIHYHGTPITPRSVLYELAGRHFCVSFMEPRDAEVCHRIGQSVMLDNGAFSHWRVGKGIIDVEAYWKWAQPWMDCPNTWLVIPDVIDDDEMANAQLLSRWFNLAGTYKQCAPVWHLHESFAYLDRLVHTFDRVCFGSSEEYAQISTPQWNNRMNEVFNRICRGSGRTPCAIHMLRGMSLSGSIYPFASVDSTDVARNHNQPQNSAREMAERWDTQQCPIRWKQQPTQIALCVLDAEQGKPKVNTEPVDTAAVKSQQNRIPNEIQSTLTSNA